MEVSSDAGVFYLFAATCEVLLNISVEIVALKYHTRLYAEVLIRNAIIAQCKHVKAF